MLGPTRPRSFSRISYVDIKSLDEKLDLLQLRRHSVPNDGNSFYHAISHQLKLLGKNVAASTIRRKCVGFLKEHTKIGDVLWERAIDSEETKEEYLVRNSRDGELADDIMIQAAAEAFQCNITVVSSDETLQVETFSTAIGEIRIGKVNGDNYVSLEGEAKMEEDRLPRLFNIRDLVSTRGILKSKSTEGSQKKVVNVEEEGEKHYGDGTTVIGIGGPGLNPLEDENDFLPNVGEEEAMLEKPLYDQYICEPPEDDQRTASSLIKFFTKTLKFFSYFLFGSIVLGAALISKASLMILVNSAKPYRPTGSVSELDNIDHDVIRVWSFIILLVMLLVPEALTMVYSLYRIIMKPQTPTEMSTLLWGLLWEALHAIGESILIFRVFPYVDATYALLIMPLVAIVPIGLQIRAKYLSVTKNKKSRQSKTNQLRRIRNLFLAIVALLLQLCGFASLFAGFFFPNQSSCDYHTICDTSSFWFCFLCPNYTYIWACIGIVFTSLRYWENFVTSTLNIPKLFKIRARSLHNKMDNSRFQVSFVYSFVKCLIVTGMAFLIFVVFENETYKSRHVLFDKDERIEPWTAKRYQRIVELFSYQAGRPNNRSEILGHLWSVFAVQICCAFATFFIGRVSCMTMIQRESFTVPLLLVTPTISALSAAVGIYKQTHHINSGMLEFFGLAERYSTVKRLTQYIDWNNYLFQQPALNNEIESKFLGGAALLVLVGLLLGAFGIILITHYLWHNPYNRLERMEVLFVKPLYGGAMIDQILLLNRRQYEEEYSKAKRVKEAEEIKKQDAEEKNRQNSSSIRNVKRRKSSRRATISRGHKFVPQLFLCATMWHETEEEMTQILTSLMRLDRDQGGRRANAQNDDDYYNFQVHILFDDAMENTSDGKEVTTNKFVHQLCSLIPLAANKVELGKGYDLPPPVIYPTPYGGRLEFVMPHGNLMVVHLKDKQKIRHRKRWSQCMYMYYILGYLQATKKAYKLEDVFLLALDGDVDFQPSAVLLLLDRMKRNPDVGAACGRIHPTGSGPVVWFQKFEYAVGHWLQKTAEHVLGCVLCSPGCFSLFRGEALVDVNVVNQYTTKATEARHYVQWDQGEDRWLCTLLLKQGWRIEYSAASDSFTFAPEDFKEFYNQRRRWGPSTMANIFDILMDAKRAVKNNVYISWGYIAYQLGLMISSLLGPATVVMIVQGAYQYVFGWSAAVGLVVSLIPVVIFIILCYTTSQDTQVAVAAILTIFYALIMMAVVVGVIGSFVTNALFDPNNLFMILLVGLYLITGILHPQELTCLLHGLLYYLCVPSAFIFLMVYSLNNMNNVSWGTREVKGAPSEGGSASEQALEQISNQNKKKRKLQIGPNDGSIYDAPNSDDGYYSCGLGNLCQCAMCINPKPAEPAAGARAPIMHQPTRRATHHYADQRRHTTVGPRRSMYKKFSVAKAQQVTGTTTDEELEAEIEKRLEKRMSLAQLRRISTKIGPDELNTATLRKLSSQHRRLSKKSLEQSDPDATPHAMSDKSKQLSQQLAEEYDDYFDDDDDFDDVIGVERMQDEEEEMLYWLVDESMLDGVIEYLDDDERDFWKYLIQQYLYPLDEDKTDKARVKAELKTLRNQTTGAYYLLNSLWLILNFALQLTITDIAIVFTIAGTVLSVNPVSFVFLVFFIVILLIQFLCMLLHRWSTTLHLLSVTSLKWKDSRDGIKNVKKKEIEREDELRKMKKKVRANGDLFGIVEDPLDRTSSGNNFSLKNRKASGPYDNPGFELDDDDTQEETSLTDSESHSENFYEKIDVHKRGFDRNPASVKFGSVNKNYLSSHHSPTRKTSTNIDFAIFGENEAVKQKEEAQREAKRSVFSSSAIDDLIDKKIESQVKHNTDGKPKQHTGVHFGPLPNEIETEDQTTAC